MDVDLPCRQGPTTDSLDDVGCHAVLCQQSCPSCSHQLSPYVFLKEQAQSPHEEGSGWDSAV